MPCTNQRNHALISRYALASSNRCTRYELSVDVWILTMVSTGLAGGLQVLLHMPFSLHYWYMYLNAVSQSRIPTYKT